MSDYIPFNVQEEILKRLPVKSLIQFRSVSKAWKSFIDSSYFIAAHSDRHAHSHRLFVRYENHPRGDKTYVCFADNDDNFLQERFQPIVPLSVERLVSSTTRMVGSSHGLLCWYGSQDESCPKNNRVAVIWNPSIRKSVTIAVPDVLGGAYNTVLGFWVCPDITDIKLVKIECSFQSFVSSIKRTGLICLPWEVEIYTLSSGCWRSSRGNTPRTSIKLMWSQEVIDGFKYWVAVDWIPKDDGYDTCNLIMSFDMTTEEFREVCLPDCLALQASSCLTISRLRDSLAVLEYGLNTQKQVCSVWEMKHVVSTSFTKLYTIKAPDPCIKKVLGFRKSGRPVMVKEDTNSENESSLSSLVVYEPCSEISNTFGIYGPEHSFFLISYMETLLLLNVPAES